MRFSRSWIAAAIFLGCTRSVVAAEPVTAPEPSPQETADEIRAIRARLNQLEQEQHDAAVKAEAQKTTEQIIDDATHRSQMLDVGSFSAGYKNNRFYLGSEDGNFLIRPFIHFQFRNVTVNQQDFKAGGDDLTQNGFEVRRLRLGFDGNMFSPDLTYWFNWGTQRTSSNANVVDSTGTKIGTVSNSLGGVMTLEEAWAKYHFSGTDFYVRGGQIRNPLVHDEIIGNVRQQTVERPISTDIFANGEGFTEAATFIYDPKTFVRVEAGINHGLRSANTDFRDYPNNGNFNAFDFGGVGRAEFKVMGDWKDYNQIGAVDVKNPLLVIGVAGDFSERGHFNQMVGVVDAMYADPSGLSLYGAFLDRYTNHNFGQYLPTTTGANITAPVVGIAGKATNEYAAFLQAGYLINKQWEPFGRFEYIHVTATAGGSHNYVPVMAGGVNYFFAGHRCKLTAQLQYLPKGIPFDDTPNDVLAMPSGKSEFSGELQFQLFI